MKTHLSLNNQNISRLSKNLSKHLKEFGFSVPHNKILNSFAKSLGFPNLHSAQNQDFQQDRKEKNYIVTVSIKHIYSNFFDPTVEIERINNHYFLFSGFEHKKFHFQLLSKHIYLSDILFNNEAINMLNDFLKKENDYEIIEVSQFFDTTSFNSKYEMIYFKNEKDIEKFDTIFLNEIKNNNEFILGVGEGTITDVKFLDATQENIDFMLKNNMIDIQFVKQR